MTTVAVPPGSLRSRGERALARPRGGGSRPVSHRLVGGLITLLMAGGVVAGVHEWSARPRPRDIMLAAKDFAFTVSALTAEAGTVAVFIDNRDPAHHDFTIKGIVKKELPADKGRRAVFEIGAGSYRFYCTLHPGDMEGTLTVTR